MANQVIVTNTGNVQVALTPPPNVQVQISRAAIGTISNVPSANFANYAANVTGANQPNITSVGVLANLTSTGTATFDNVIVNGNLQIGNLVANNANFANYAGNAFNVSGSNVSGAVANATYANSANTANSATVANSANSVTLANVGGAGNIASINLDGNASNILFGNGVFSAVPNISNVANANYANFAGTAYSVDGANVVGAVSNAIYAVDSGASNTANSALTAGVANSVAVANVVGIGNIATVNLDGNVSNVLSGNGTFVALPTVSANANYANFAGTAFNVSGSNVSGEVANANYSSYSNVAASANSVAVGNVSGIGNIATINLDGNVSNVLSGNGTFIALPTVSSNANYANFAGQVVDNTQSNITQVGNLANLTVVGAITSTSIISPVGGGANIDIAPDGIGHVNINADTLRVGDNNTDASIYTRGTGNLTLKTHDVQTNESNITIVNGATGNIELNPKGIVVTTSNIQANYFIGNGSQLTDINGANVSNVANANYAAYAGNVTVADQPNITSVGNLPYLQVSNSANATGVVNQLASNNITFASNFTNVVSYKITTAYHPNASTGYPAERIVRSRGNATAPTTAVSGDRISQRASYAYNGNTNVVAVLETFALAGTVNANANAAYTGGQWTLATGNPQGATGNVNAISGQNGLVFTNSGALTITPGTAPNVSLGQTESAIFMQSWGLNTTDPVTVGGINSQRARGNRDGALSVQPGDNLGRFNAWGYNGTTYQFANSAGFVAEVAGDYVANATIIPIDMRIRTVSNTGAGKNTTFYGNGTVSFPGDTTTTGNITSGNANLGNLTIANYFSGDGSLLSNVNGSNVSNVANANYANFAGNAITLANGTSNVSIPVANGNVNISTNGNANIAQFDTNGTLFLYPTTSATNGLRITSFGNPVSGDVNRIAVSRARGNATTPLSVNPNDNIMRFLAFAYNGAGYQTSSTGSIRAVVDASYVANGANIPVGWNMSVNDTNGGVNNQSKVHNFYSNGNVVFANSVFATDAFFAGGNITSNVGVFSGNGSGLSAITGANVSGEVAYAAVANSVAVANVSGIGNIAVINLDGSNANVLYGNGVFAPTAGGGSNIANGTSNVSIPTANGNILFSTAGNANVVDIQAIGTFNVKPPAQGPLSAIRIDTYGRSGNVGAQRINSTRYRGNATTPLSVQPNDFTMELLTVGYNGAAVQTNSIASFNAIVDSSYTANAANIPLGWQLRVNDTNGGVNNQSKIHNFYSNGAVSLVGNITGSGALSLSGNLSTTGGLTSLSNSTGGNTTLYMFGDKTTNSNFSIDNAQFSVTMANVDTTTGFSPFRFQQYAPTSSQFGPMYMYRARGDNFFTQAPVVANDYVMSLNFIVNSNNTVASIGTFNSVVTYNDNAGNVGSKFEFNASGTGANGYLNGSIVLNANTTTANNFSANNISTTGNANIATANITAGAITSGNIGNLQLNKFNETVYAIGNTSGTITPDFNNGSIQSLTATGNITLNSLANAAAGSSMTLLVTQGSGGNFILSSTMKYANAYKILSTTGGNTDIISVFYDGSTYWASLTVGYA